MGDLAIRDQGASTGSSPLAVQIQEPVPANHAFIYLRKSGQGELRAWICASCGFAEIYATNLGDLYHYYKMSHPEAPTGA